MHGRDPTRWPETGSLSLLPAPPPPSPVGPPGPAPRRRFQPASASHACAAQRSVRGLGANLTDPGLTLASVACCLCGLGGLL